jgi:2',3'-cyclic-nucleotide 2'-phosphodiesterase (5'-nucleotidase family)
VSATGGFRRRATYIQQQRQQVPSLILVDTGDAFVGGGPLGDMTQGEVIVAGMNLMGYDAMALGPEELSLGKDLLRQRMQEAEFAILSANVVLRDTDELLAQPYAVVPVDGHRLGLIGLTRPPEGPGGDFRVLDPQQAAERYVAELAGQADVVVVLTNLAYRDGLALASATPGIDLLITALPDQVLQQAIRAPGTGTIIIAAEQPTAGHTGRRVGRLAVTVGSDGVLSGESWGSVPMDATIADDPQMKELLDRYRP